MGSSPERPCDDMGGLDFSSSKAGGDASDFLDRPPDQRRGARFIRRIVFWGAALA